jgi:hypothetical protein
MSASVTRLLENVLQSWCRYGVNVVSRIFIGPSNFVAVSITSGCVGVVVRVICRPPVKVALAICEINVAEQDS